MGKRKSLASALRLQQTSDKRTKLASGTREPPVPKKKQREQKTSRPRSGLVPFTPGDRILFVGEGNFSFAASCVENHLEHASDVLATSLDDRESLLAKYPDAQTHVDTVTDCCGTVAYGVDATRLQQHCKGRVFDVCVFMFPHVGAGIADEARNVLTNQKMLTAFFKSVQTVLTPTGTVAVTLAQSKTYDLWDLRGLAKSQGLIVRTSGAFDGALFPGYTHRRTQGHTEKDHGFSGGRGEERSARWTLFAKREAESQSASKQQKGHDRTISDSEDED